MHYLRDSLEALVPFMKEIHAENTKTYIYLRLKYHK